MATTLTDPQTIHDFITGLAFLGTGGGAGKIEDALEMLEPVSKRAKASRSSAPTSSPTTRGRARSPAGAAAIPTRRPRRRSSRSTGS